MEGMEWVMVKKPSESELWEPSYVGVKEPPPSKPLKVEFKGPAQHWTDAIPIGNGRFGAMVWGGVQSETLNLNEDTLWTGTPGDYKNPEAPKALAVVRKLVDNGQYAEATTEAVKLSDTASDVYQPLGDMKLEFEDSDSPYSEGSYSRELDLNTATARIKYSVGDIEFTREHFSSYIDQVIVTKISASKPGSVTFTVYLDSKLHHSSHVIGLNGERYQISMEGSCPGLRTAPKLNGPKGIQFCTTLELQISENAGSVKVVDAKKLRVEGSDWVVLRMVASSSFDGPFTKPSESKRNPSSQCVDFLNSITKLSYEDLYMRHLDDYQTLFHRASLQLSKSSKIAEEKRYSAGVVAKVSTAERVKSFQTDEDPSLVELLFQYGRYLLISSSRPGTQVSNLQGIWNEKTQPAWDCAPHLNINLQMNYWPSLSCNLHECQEPLFDYMSSLAVNGSKTAHVNYEASGWVAHQVSDLWAKTSPDRGEAVWALWPMGGAWLCTHLWEHYTYTMDKKGLQVTNHCCTDKFGILVTNHDRMISYQVNKGFLGSKAYPLLEGCASFLLDWLIEGQGGYLETNPSTSPEHMFIAPDGKPASVSYSSTMDMSIIREVFADVLSAAEILGKSEDNLVERVRKAQPRLLPTKVARDGSILEWAQDFQDPEVHHRHVSHLFGLFPGHTITMEKNPDLCKAVDNTLYKRGEDGPGWSTTWKASLWARLRNSEHAYRMVKHLFDLVDPDREGDFEGGMYSNLFTAHPPFQIDANFGFAAAIAEMLVQSTIKDLILLPALPRDKWANGCVKGLKARGGLTVSICWTEGDLHEVGLYSIDSNSVKKRLHYKGTTVDATILGGRVYTFNKLLKCVKMHCL